MLADLESQFVGIKDLRKAFYRCAVKVDELLSRSFPDVGGADRFREMVKVDVCDDRIGISATADGQFSFPVVILFRRKVSYPAASGLHLLDFPCEGLETGGMRAGQVTARVLFRATGANQDTGVS